MFTKYKLQYIKLKNTKQGSNIEYQFSKYVLENILLEIIRNITDKK